MNNEEEIYNRDPHQSSRSFYVLFALQFLPILASIFIEVKLGIATLAIIVPMTFITLIACSNRQTDWSHSRNIILSLFSYGAYIVYWKYQILITYRKPGILVLDIIYSFLLYVQFSYRFLSVTVKVLNLYYSFGESLY